MTSHTRRLLVLVQVATQRERLATSSADVRLVGRVRLDVSSKVRLVGERLAAVGTAERFLASVGADVALEQPRPRKALATLRALAALTVRSDVHAVGRGRRVDLVAVWTLAGRWAVATVRGRPATLLLLLLVVRMRMEMVEAGGGRTMTLTVSGQVAGGAVRSTALGTRVQRRSRCRHVHGRTDRPSGRSLRHTPVHRAHLDQRLSIGGQH